jgi:hypothetical protein
MVLIYARVYSDTDMIKTYFQDNCYEAVLQYSNNLKTLIDRVGEWNDNKTSKLYE